jgi:lysozyme family protein
MSIDSLIEGVIGREGAFTDNPADPGGATMWGITERVARRHGYAGPMAALPRSTAKQIYFAEYVVGPGFVSVMPLSDAIAEELVDTGVNMGPAVAAIFLQKALNTFNDQGRDYADLKVDGDVGPATIAALKALLAKRGHDGETVMLRALNALQGEHYISIGAARPASEAFEFGWFLRRVAL